MPDVGVFRPIGDTLHNPLGQYNARKWLRDCVQNHDSCRRMSDVMPTRLLELMPTGTSIKLRVLESDGLSVDYAALSHCWGTAGTLKTTTENIQSMRNDIPVSNLPKTFQDAVRLCQELEIKYLWIDSLCIIQHDAAEWRREAGRMATVYGNAFLVLVASASAGDALGMYPKRIHHFTRQIDVSTLR